MQHGSAIDSVGQGLAHTYVFQNWIAQVERHIGQHSSWLLFDNQLRVATKRSNHVRAEGPTGRNIGAAFAQFQRPRGGIRDDGQPNVPNPAMRAPLSATYLKNNWAA